MSPVSTPDRTTEQRLTALERANEIRFRRARLKRDVKARKVDVAPLIKDPPEWLETMKVMELLLALPWVGRVKVNKALKMVQVSHVKTVGGLSQRQRDELVWWLD